MKDKIEAIECRIAEFERRIVELDVARRRYLKLFNDAKEALTYRDTESMRSVVQWREKLSELNCKNKAAVAALKELEWVLNLLNEKKDRAL